MVTGTAKQIEWATKIRAQFLQDVRETQQAQAARAAKAGQGAQWDAIMSDVMTQAEAQTDAAWWIDNRQHTDVGGRGKLFREMYTAAVQSVQKASK